MATATSHRLADGRELVFFTRDGQPEPQFLGDRRPLGRRSGGSEVRLDRLSQEWVAVAAHRQTRTYLPPADQCPLCPTREGSESEVPAASFDTAVFENRFPSLGPGLGAVDGEEWGHPVPGTGRCEVVVFTPEHTGAFATLGFERARVVVEAWARRTEALSALDGIAQVFVFENRGQEIGVTLHHPHGQIYAYPYVPFRSAQIDRAARAHLARSGVPLQGELLAAERDAGTRMVLQGEHWSAFVPYAARWPMEVHVVPHRQVPDLAALTGEERDEFTHLYLDLLQRLDRLYPTPMPYIAGWHQTPVDPAAREAGWLHLQVTSPRRSADKLKFLAGSEAGVGAFINDTRAEDVAATLRELA